MKMKKNKNKMKHMLRTILASGFWCTLAPWAQAQQPEEIPLEDERWKRTDNLLIKTENKTGRMEELEHSSESDKFVYFRSNKNNWESFRATCKFIPTLQQETDAEMNGKLRWKLESERGRVLKGDQDQDYDYPYEADLKDVNPDEGVQILVLMRVEERSKETGALTKTIKGQVRKVFIDDPNLAMSVKSMSFNTHQGVIQHDAFDIVDGVKKKNILNETPEFKDGKQVSDKMIVVYPTRSTPVVKTELQLSSKKLDARKLEKYVWGARAETYNQEPQNSGPDRDILQNMNLQGELKKNIVNGKLVLSGNFESEKELGNDMCKGKIDLEWVLRQDGEDVALKKLARAVMKPAYLVLRQQEIDQTPKSDTKMWPLGIEIAVNVVTQRKDKDPLTCSDPVEYAKILTEGIYAQSWYPEAIFRRYHTVGMDGNGQTYDIYLKKLTDEFVAKKGDVEIICVEAAALFRAMQNLVTDGTAQASDLKPLTSMKHQIAMFRGIVYDATPFQPPKKNKSVERPPLESYRKGTSNLQQYLLEHSKKNPSDPWSLFRANVPHRLSEF